jgi:hypothetical protein
MAVFARSFCVAMFHRQASATGRIALPPSITVYTRSQFAPQALVISQRGLHTADEFPDVLSAAIAPVADKGSAR